MTASSPTPIDPRPPRIDAALIAAEATLRRNDDVAAVFVVAPHDDAPAHNDLTILRLEHDRPNTGIEAGASPFHVPHWARTLLASTEGVR